MSNRRIDLAIVRHQVANVMLANPELEEDGVLRADMIEGETNLVDLLRACEVKRREAIKMIAGLECIAKDDQTRLARFKRQRDSMRDLQEALLEAGQLDKVVTPEATYAMANSPSRVIVITEDELPEEYIRIVRTPDLIKIGTALKSGKIVPGASLNNPKPHLVIRTK